MSDDLTTAYNLGYTCAKDMARDEIERLRAAYEAMDKMLREANQQFMRVDMKRNKLRAENEKLREAIAAERERCAKIAERYLSNNEPVRLTASSIAAAIRDSGQ